MGKILYHPNLLTPTGVIARVIRKGLNKNINRNCGTLEWIQMPWNMIETNTYKLPIVTSPWSHCHPKSSCRAIPTLLYWHCHQNSLNIPWCFPIYASAWTLYLKLVKNVNKSFWKLAEGISLEYLNICFMHLCVILENKLITISGGEGGGGG